MERGYTVSPQGDPGCRKLRTYLLEHFPLFGVSGEVLVLVFGGSGEGGWRSPFRPFPTHRMRHPVTATQAGTGAAFSPRSYPTTTSAWLSSPCYAASGPWASLPSAWPRRSVCGWGWEGAGYKRKAHSQQDIGAMRGGETKVERRICIETWKGKTSVSE